MASEKIGVAVAGVAGRMGGRIVHALAGHPRLELVAGFEAPGHPAVGRPLAEVVGLAQAPGRVGDDPAAALEGARVLINFTAPEPSLEQAALAADMGRACVIGTTGFSSGQERSLAELGRRIPLVWAPNMSVGMNLMFKLVGMIARVLGPDYALEMVEAHHDQKKDAPSGTAVRLLRELARARGWDHDEVAVHGRRGMVGARGREEIGVSVIRGGDIVGDHTVMYIGQGERIELTHRAHSRDTFARGAVRAADWVVGQGPGLYDMQDVLGLAD